ncbi:hypothetical protein F3Y22_tig00110796pilonHSYRG00006 [Hibiscus syriacus]|uniref:Uncharacterized protein n=1 Tax=Hibiscus syriacus TaxID=106335 RepID=A0A6A2ZRT3_HIBSY|nr:hypothetical protein F3Y22_tig00110796pilonHSYRG00006 [Hibiscus syriacus]
MENLAPQEDRLSKKARRLDEEPPDAGGTSPNHMDIEAISKAALETSPGPTSYRDTLFKDNHTDHSIEEEIMDEEDVEVFEDDVVRGVVEGLISIDFSDRVQAMANKSFDQTVVVKLLGRRIGYTTLRNKFYDLWKPSQPFRLMDIENDYFLVSLRTRSDFLTALSDGTWTIFRHYLIVEPWSSDFSSSQLFPRRIVAWIRLSRLPRGSGKTLTSKLLINGHIQIVEHESLPTICFSCGRYEHVKDICPENTIEDQQEYDALKEQVTEAQLSNANQKSKPFGPWMVIERRQRKNFKKLSTDSERNMETNGSRFNPLYESTDDANATAFEQPNQSSKSNQATHPPSSTPQAQSSKARSSDHHAAKSKTTTHVRKPLTIPKVTARSSKGYYGQSSHQPCQNTVEPRVSILDRSKYLTIVLSENTNPNTTDDIISHATQGNSQHKLILRKPSDTNHTQGCGHPRFLTVFRQYLRDFKPNLVAIFEPQISGGRADVFIAVTGLSRSHRIEATGFSGGIWLYWHDKIQVDILLNHLQFIHCRISTTQGNFSTLASFIYANPNSTKRKLLWPHLQSLAGYFQDFVYDFGIRDMGFQGPEFTWNRGLSYAHLDRALCNSKWDKSYPETAVHHLHRMRSDHRPLLLCVGSPIANIRPYQFKYFYGWLQHDDFSRMVEDNWVNSETFSATISHLTEASDIWNKTVFAELLIELEKLLDQEETLWKQRSRVNWTAQALKDMTPLKAHGHDGLHANFFQKQWHVVSHSVCSMVKKVFAGGHKVSKQKTHIYFSPNTVTETKTAILSCLGFQEVDHMGKYLGVPVLHSRMKATDFDFIFNKFMEAQSQVLVPVVIPHVLNVRPPEATDIFDALVWKWDLEHHFTIKSAYTFLMEDSCRNLWLRVVPHSAFASFFGVDLQSWITQNIQKQQPGATYKTDSTIHSSYKWAKCYANSSKVPVMYLRGSIGGVIRNSNGEWITGFTKNIGTTSILHAELWSIYEGLLIARNLGIHRLWIQSDCSKVVKLVGESGSIDNHIPLLRAILKLRQSGCWVTKIQWISRNGNKIADRMAKLASRQHYNLVHFNSPRMS